MGLEGNVVQDMIKKGRKTCYGTNPAVANKLYWSTIADLWEAIECFMAGVEQRSLHQPFVLYINRDLQSHSAKNFDDRIGDSSSMLTIFNITIPASLINACITGPWTTIKD